MEEISLNNIESNLTDDLVNDLTESEPIVITDKDDYAPGETAQITGSGFTPESEVVIQIVDDPADPGDDGDVDEYQAISVITDEFGSFTTSWFVPIDNNASGSGIPDALNATLFLTATGTGADSLFGTGDDQIAETTFTDAGRPGSNNRVSSSSSGGGDTPISSPDSVTTEVSITLVSDGIDDAIDVGTSGFFSGAVASYTRTSSEVENFNFVNLDLKAELVENNADEIIIEYTFLDDEGVEKEQFSLIFSAPPFSPAIPEILDAQTVDNLVNDLPFISANLFSTYPVETFPGLSVDDEIISQSSTNVVIPIEPVATDNAAEVVEDLAIVANGNLITDDDGAGLDFVPEGNSLNVSEIDGVSDPNIDLVGTYGTLNWNTDGSYTYRLNNEDVIVQSLGMFQEVTETFTYTLIGDGAGSDTAELAITIFGNNDAPEAIHDAYITQQNGGLIVTAADGVLANDSDIDAGDTILEVTNLPLTNVPTINPANGILTLNSDGSFIYTPDTDFIGIDTFTYTVVDDSFDASTATVTIEVTNPVNGTRNDDNINGTVASDFIAANNGNDTVNARGGNDTVEGGRGGDIISGGLGDDLLAADRVDLFDDFDGDISEIRGNSGNDTIFGGAKNDLLIGNSGNDSIFGKSGDDELRGGRDDDLLNGGVGNDRIQGGSGIDTADYSDLAINGVFGNVAGLDANLRNGEFKHSSTNNPLTWTDTVSGIENVTGTQRNDRFVNKNMDNVFDGQGEVGRSDRITTFESIFTDGSYIVTGDVVEYQGNITHYSFAGNADNFTVTRNDQTDTLIDIEFVKFDDGVFATAELNFV